MFKQIMRSVARVSGAFLLTVTTSFLSGCGGGGSAPAAPSAPPTANQVPVTVQIFNANNPFPNRPYVSVTVCDAQNHCQDIDHILLDTGSTGLRIMPGVLNISLPAQVSANGLPIAECMRYGAGYFWGAQRLATVKMAGEVATNIPLTVAGDASIPSSAPDGCAATGPNAISGLPEFNGILGIGPQQVDCGANCEQSASSQMYFVCQGTAAGSCTATTMPMSMQTPNPVSRFATDNNGTVLSLPAAVNALGGMVGTLTFGIGTQPNNALNGVQMYRSSVPGLDFPLLAANVDGVASFAFLDTGTNAYNLAQTGTPSVSSPPPFLQAISGLAVCGQAGGPYCPPAPTSLQVRLNGSNGNPTSWQTITLADPTTAFQNGLAVIPTLAFQNSGFPGFSILGLPFYFGRTVATAITGSPTPYGPGPYWAF